MNVASQLKFQNVLRGCNILLGYQRVSQRLSMREKVAEFFWTKTLVSSQDGMKRVRRKRIWQMLQNRDQAILSPPFCCSSPHHAPVAPLSEAKAQQYKLADITRTKAPGFLQIETENDCNDKGFRKKECKSQKGWKQGKSGFSKIVGGGLWQVNIACGQLLSNLFYCCVFRSIKSEFELLCWFPGPEPSPAVPAVNFPGLTFHPPCYAPSPWYRPAQCTNTNTQTRLQNANTQT